MYKYVIRIKTKHLDGQKVWPTWSNETAMGRLMTRASASQQGNSPGLCERCIVPSHNHIGELFQRHQLTVGVEVAANAFARPLLFLVYQVFRHFNESKA